jgi:hypothetical protein
MNLKYVTQTISLALIIFLGAGCASSKGGFSPAGRAICYTAATLTGATVGVGTSMGVGNATSDQGDATRDAAAGGIGALIGVGVCYAIDAVTDSPPEDNVRQDDELIEEEVITFRCRGAGCPGNIPPEAQEAPRRKDEAKKIRHDSDD